MTDPYRTNAVDETEVAKERVRQTAETRRKEIEEREATKRAKAPGPKADELYIHCKCPAARSDGAK